MNVDVPGFPPQINVVSEADVRRALSLIERANDLIVRDDDTVSLARSLNRDMNDVVKSVDARRTQVKRPVLDLGKAIDAVAKGVTDPLKHAIDQTKRKLAVYVAEIERQQAEAEQARREAEQRAVDEYKQTGRAAQVDPVFAAPVVNAPDVATRTVRKIVIDDPDQVPREFMIPDIPRLEQAVLRDGRAIAGVRVVEERIVVNR